MITTLMTLLLCTPSFSFSTQARASHETSARTTRSALHVSMVSTFLREPPDNVENRESTADKRRKQNRKKNKSHHQQRSQKNGHMLHSKRVSELSESSTAEDVMLAIKRAQNLRDVQDLRVIGWFLLQEVDDSFAYGYKGSLLSRLSVAALRLGEELLAKQAIQVRKDRFSLSMTPFENAAIVRAMNRANKVDDAFKIVQDEFPLTSCVRNVDLPNVKEILKYRALSLASIASHSFFKQHPADALRACQMLAEMGPTVLSFGLDADDLNMPWTRILEGAKQCRSEGAGKKYYAKVVGHAMKAFPLNDSTGSEVDSVVSMYS